MDYYKESLNLHKEHRGKLGVKSKVSLNDKDDLSLAYTPGVSEPCRAISQDKEKAYDYTNKANAVAVVTDGSAVLGLGNIGPEAALPVMEGKAILFKEFADIDAYPICLNTQFSEDIINTVQNIAPGFGGINLEDIEAPKCFTIEEELKKRIDIPVFHDDQHGTAVVVMAALINALKLVGKAFSGTTIVISGAGAAALATARFLLTKNPQDIILVDSKGIIDRLRKYTNPYKEDISKMTNRNNISGNLTTAMQGSDVFIGLSVADIVSREMVQSMKEKAIIFALANPEPEIDPATARSAGAYIIATGRSDFPNQINNVLGFPGIFRGALDARAKDISEEMKIAAAHTLANIIEPSPDRIIPSPLDKTVVPAIAQAVKDAAISSGISRVY